MTLLFEVFKFLVQSGISDFLRTKVFCWFWSDCSFPGKWSFLYWILIYYFDKMENSVLESVDRLVTVWIVWQMWRHCKTDVFVVTLSSLNNKKISSICVTHLTRLLTRLWQFLKIVSPPQKSCTDRSHHKDPSNSKKLKKWHNWWQKWHNFHRILFSVCLFTQIWFSCDQNPVIEYFRKKVLF